MSSIGIIGYGIVGQALASGFTNHLITYYDKYKETERLEDVAQKSEFIFICLPTPMFDDETGIDLSLIEDSIDQLVQYTNQTDKIIIIKSTVIPGTTARIAEKYPQTNFCFNPEYLTEAHFKEDFQKAERTVIGASDRKVLERVSQLYQDQFPQTKIITSDPTTAEMAKYMANCYLAMKVIFGYEMADYCKALGIDYHQVKDIAVTDKRIYDSHLNLEGDAGFGGKCFPKDMVSLLHLGHQLKVDTSLLETVWEKNKKIRQHYDWKDIKFAVSSKKDE